MTDPIDQLTRTFPKKKTTPLEAHARKLQRAKTKPAIVFSVHGNMPKAKAPAKPKGRSK